MKRECDILGKYLEELGAEKLNWVNDDRLPIWEEERRVYGFDERETWSLDFAFYEWLYERLMMFRDRAENIIDLDYSRFQYNGQEYTQRQLIDMMLKRLRIVLTEENPYGERMEKWDYIHEIEKIWGVVLPAMWW